MTELYDFNGWAYSTLVRILTKARTNRLELTPAARCSQGRKSNVVFLGLVMEGILPRIPQALHWAKP